MEGFLRYRFGGLIFGGAYTWRDLFSEFYVIIPLLPWPTLSLRIIVVVGLRLLYILQAM